MIYGDILKDYWETLHQIEPHPTQKKKIWPIQRDKLETVRC